MILVKMLNLGYQDSEIVNITENVRIWNIPFKILDSKV